MPKKSKKLLPWLVTNLSNGTYEQLGLRWQDSEEGLFWLPWPRQKNKKWTTSVSQIFIDYNCELQGRNSRDDHIANKTRFRTALYKEKCIEEVCVEKQRKLMRINDRAWLPVIVKTNIMPDSPVVNSLDSFSDNDSSNFGSPTSEEISTDITDTSGSPESITGDDTANSWDFAQLAQYNAEVFVLEEPSPRHTADILNPELTSIEDEASSQFSDSDINLGQLMYTYPDRPTEEQRDSNLPPLPFPS